MTCSPPPCNSEGNQLPVEGIRVPLVGSILPETGNEVPIVTSTLLKVPLRDAKRNTSPSLFRRPDQFLEVIVTVARTRAYKLQLSKQGIHFYLRCHDSLCRRVGDLLPYGNTLFVSMLLMRSKASEEIVEALLDPDLDRLGGKTIRYVGTMAALSGVAASITLRVEKTEMMHSPPRLWRLFLAALSMMEEAQPSTLQQCYEEMLRIEH